MTLIDRLQRQLEIRRNNQGQAVQDRAPAEAEDSLNLTLSPENGAREEESGANSLVRLAGEVSRRTGEDNRMSSQRQAETRQGILDQLERLRRLQEGSSRNFRSQVADRRLHSDFGGEIRATPAGSFLYLTELYEHSNIQVNGHDPESDPRLALSLVRLLTGKQIECEP